MVEQVEAVEEGRGEGNFMQVQVMMDVAQPLCRGRKVWLGGDVITGCLSNLNVFRTFVTGVVVSVSGMETVTYG